MESPYTIRLIWLPNNVFFISPTNAQMQVFSQRSFAALLSWVQRCMREQTSGSLSSCIHKNSCIPLIFLRGKSVACHNPAPPSSKHFGNLENLAGFFSEVGWICLFSAEYDLSAQSRDGLTKPLCGRGKLSLSLLLQYRFYKLTTGLNL